MILRYDTLTSRIAFRDTDRMIFENDEGLCIWFGRVRMDVERVMHKVLTSAEDDDCSDSFVGPFLLIVYDKVRRFLSIKQHYFGMPVSLYYAQHERNIWLSTSLNRLREVLTVRFELNTQMLPHFFYNGFLPDSHTLIKGISKLPPGYRARLDSKGIRIGTTAYRFSDSSPLSDEALYEQVIPNGIISAAGSDIDMFDIALSGGYDSNCILYYLRQLYSQSRIRAYSVGGIEGVDETGVARAIAGMYPNTQLFCAKVTPFTLNAMDEIVCRLEGAVYERGIFLQYELAKLLNEHECRRMVCGECADQVFHEDSYRRADRGIFLYGYAQTPYEMASYVVLQKNTRMLGSFGIEGAYPFLDMDVLRLGYRTRERNGREKRFHKEQCLRLLPDDVGAMLQKTGGSTSLSSLVDPSFDCTAAVQRMKYYSKDFKITGKYERREAELDYYLSLRYLESFERQFCD